MHGHSHRLPAGPWQVDAWRAPGSPVCTSAHPPDKFFPPPGTPGPTAWGPLPQRAGKGQRACSAHSLPLAQAPGRDKTRLQILRDHPSMVPWEPGWYGAGCVTLGLHWVHREDNQEMLAQDGSGVGPIRVCRPPSALHERALRHWLWRARENLL